MKRQRESSESEGGKKDEDEPLTDATDESSRDTGASPATSKMDVTPVQHTAAAPGKALSLLDLLMIIKTIFNVTIVS